MNPFENLSKYKGKKVAVGLSGGVDSAVTALLLKQAGCHVTAFYMQNWREDDELCHQQFDKHDAKLLADQIGIEFDVINFEHEYHTEVFSEMLSQYQLGWVPNPDIWCNQSIKFHHFFNYIDSHHFDYLATGHYAQITSSNHDEYLLGRADDDFKDQTYFLCGIEKNTLPRLLFPLGQLLKKEVRTIASKHGLIVADKKDSTGICFVGPSSIKTFLRSYLITKPGNIETENGSVVGKHDGVIYYTLGQRQGLAIGGIKDAEEKPWYLVEKKIKDNVLIVSQVPHQNRYLIKSIICQTFNWLIAEMPTSECQCKTRHGKDITNVKIRILDSDHVQIFFLNPIYQLSLGQWCALYNDQFCYGGGQISKIIHAG